MEVEESVIWNCKGLPISNVATHAGLVELSPMMIVKQMCSLAEVSRLDGDHTNPELGHFLPHGTAEAFKGVFGSAVNRQTWVAVKASHTAYVHDAA